MKMWIGGKITGVREEPGSSAGCQQGREREIERERERKREKEKERDREMH